MAQWNHCYLIVQNIRLYYPQGEFTLPPEFRQNIPGLDIYIKYKNVISKEGFWRFLRKGVAEK